MVEADAYSSREATARRRIDRLTDNDWPVFAAALARGGPIWTEDIEFSGCGVEHGHAVLTANEFRVHATTPATATGG